MIDIFFIRHGATEGNLRRRYIGRTDEPLCEAGIAQVKALQKRGLSVDRLFVSPMLRTRQTADILFPKMPYTVVDGLIETDFGRFEGKSADKLSGDPAYQAWVDAMCLTPIPEGESVTDFKTRCCEAFAETIKNVPDGSRVGFVVHAGGPQGRPRSVHQILIGDGHTVPPNQKSNGITAWDHQASAPFSWGRTSFRAWIATSSMESSGSKVVKFCIQRPGAARIFVNQLSWAPTKWLIS